VRICGLWRVHLKERPSVTLEDIEEIKIEQSFAKKQSESCTNRQQVTISPNNPVKLSIDYRAIQDQDVVEKENTSPRQ